MLDTKARKYVQPIIKATANKLLNIGLTPNLLTIGALFTGLISSFLLYFSHNILAVLMLWFSGYLDSVDGTMARINKTSPWGALLDITFDRIVEFSVIFTLALKNPDSCLLLLFLSGTILFSITVFLTVGALSQNTGVKSFYYQPGFAERTEGFIFFSIMMLIPIYLNFIIIAFALLILITVFQRLYEAYTLLK